MNNIDHTTRHEAEMDAAESRDVWYMHINTGSVDNADGWAADGYDVLSTSELVPVVIGEDGFWKEVDQS